MIGWFPSRQVNLVIIIIIVAIIINIVIANMAFKTTLLLSLSFRPI